MFLTTIIMALCLLACFVTAGWSVLRSPVYRRQMQAFLGLSCIAAGSGSFVVVTSALLATTSLQTPAQAGDTAWRAGSVSSLLTSAASSDSAPTDSVQDSADEAGSSAGNPQNKPASSTTASDQQGADAPRSPSAAGPRSSDSDAASSAEGSSSDSLHELPRVEHDPEFNVIIPPGRPAWVDTMPLRVGPIHSTAVTSGPYASTFDAAHALDVELADKTREYIVEYLGSDLAGQLVRYDLRQIKTQLVKPENLYNEEIVVSIGPMHQQHALLEFGPEFRSDLDQRWARVMGTSRLLQMGLLVGGVLCLLGMVFGYFRVDNATRGFYTGRLQAMAAVAILALVGAGLFFARMIPWL